MTFEIRDISGQYGPDGTVIKTIVTLYQQQPYFATASFPLDGNHTTKSPEELLELVKQAFFKEHYTAYAFKELDTTVGRQTAEIDKLTKLAEVSVLAAVTNADNPADPTIYKRFLELIDLAKPGQTYKPYDVFTLENPEHKEKYGEGKRVLVQVNQEFTYTAETVADFVTDGPLELAGVGVAFPWEAPKQ